jgi:hypothetical protein
MSNVTLVDGNGRVVEVSRVGLFPAWPFNEVVDADGAGPARVRAYRRARLCAQDDRLAGVVMWPAGTGDWCLMGVECSRTSWW